MKKLPLHLLWIVIFSYSSRVWAGEGMWLPLLLQALNEDEMQAMGMKMSAEDIYSINHGSLKDAIVHFGGFCTSSIISPEGLLLTNHHCGYGAIQDHSSLDRNYLEEGFWARSREEELMNPGLTATLIVRIEDVTQKVLRGVRDEMEEAERQSLIDQNIAYVQQHIQKEDWQDVAIKPFFHGNQYFAFITVTYRDVRLVGAPPSSIGKFGADTDNWIWPRHTGDFSLFRIYAGPDNLPADPSPDNVPYRPKHFLPISLDGVAEGDFTLVFGFPGRTNEYLPAVAVDHIATQIDPLRIAIRDKTLKIWDEAMRSDPQVKIQYASKFASLANGWKKWQGEVLGLKKTDAVGKKRRYEEQFAELVASRPNWKAQYSHILPTFEQLYAQVGPLEIAQTRYYETVTRNIEMLRIASYLRRLVRTWKHNGPEAYVSYRNRLVSYLEGFYKDYRPELDQRVFAQQMADYFQHGTELLLNDTIRNFLPPVVQPFTQLAAQLYSQSLLPKGSELLKLLTQDDGDKVTAAILSDPAYQLFEALEAQYQRAVGTPLQPLRQQVDRLMRLYMRAQMEVFAQKRFYPDANGTMRVSYGRVEGYYPRDGVHYLAQTWLEGVMEKYIPGDYEFDLPQKLRRLYQRKDYGPYGENGRMPVCFIGSNHTTGGNSGSPVIDAYGNLIGLNFDRAWEGTMSDLNYDIRLCRNIMVDIRYVLFIIDKFAEAHWLIDEMKLVHPKRTAHK